jgi:hypothetical protein
MTATHTSHTSSAGQHNRLISELLQAKQTDNWLHLVEYALREIKVNFLSNIANSFLVPRSELVCLERGLPMFMPTQSAELDAMRPTD